MTASPLSCPPRIAQADYRQGYVVFLAATATAAAFDTTNTSLQTMVTQALGRLQWTQTAAGPRVSDKSFRPVLDAVIAQQQYLNTAVFINALPAHPDRVDAATQQRMAMSLMLQGWLPYLGDEGRAWAVERCGLAQTYLEAVPMDHATGCAQCGGELPQLNGARCAICERCGAEVAYSHALCCDGCGKHLTLARHLTHASHDALNCPYCRRRISLQGLVWPEVVLTDYTVAGCASGRPAAGGGNVS